MSNLLTGAQALISWQLAVIVIPCAVVIAWTFWAERGQR